MNYIIYYTSILSPLPAIWFGKSNRYVLWYYACICFIADIVNYTLKAVGLKHALVSNAFILLEFLLVTFYFRKVFFDAKGMVGYVVMIIILGALYLMNTYSLTVAAKSDVQAYNYIDASFFYIMYIVLSLFGLYKVMKEVQSVKLERSSLFLACVAFLLYASGAFFLFLFKDKATENDLELYSVLWVYFFMPLNITKNILLAYSLKNASRSGYIRAK